MIASLAGTHAGAIYLVHSTSHEDRQGDRRSHVDLQSDEHTIVVRDRDLSKELIGKISFVDHFFLLVIGRMATAGEAAVLNATLPTSPCRTSTRIRGRSNGR